MPLEASYVAFLGVVGRVKKYSRTPHFSRCKARGESIDPSAQCTALSGQARGIAEPQPAACLCSIFKRNNIFYRNGLIKTLFVHTILLENIKAMTKDKAPKYNIDLTVEVTQGAW